MSIGSNDLIDLVIQVYNKSSDKSAYKERGLITNTIFSFYSIVSLKVHVLKDYKGAIKKKTGKPPQRKAKKVW